MKLQNTTSYAAAMCVLWGCGTDKTNGTVAPHPSSSDATSSSATSELSSITVATDGTNTNQSSSGESTEPECVDEYPFDDDYTCEQQAEWGKCEESWLQGYCQKSCNRCGEPPPEEGPDLSGERNVFTEYTPKALLAPTPPMGWNSWNKFACDINETLIKETADAIVATGMKDVGYQYVNIDDCWQTKERDADGKLVADPERFPSGIKAVADYVHSKGLKLG